MSKHLTVVGVLRLRQILGPTGPIPISASSWWAGVKKGIYPQPIKLGPRMTAWRASDIEALVQRGIPACEMPANSTHHHPDGPTPGAISTEADAIPTIGVASERVTEG
jgi:predicted DNA-binding transcriptional regulator AlpA